MTAIEAEAMARLCASQWPGNIRQLRNVIEWGINFADGNILRCADLPPDLDLPDTPPADGQADSYAAWSGAKYGP